MKIKRVKVPIYFGNLVMIHTDSWEPFELKYGGTMSDCWSAVVTKDDRGGKCDYVVAFKGKPSGAIIAHEVVHLVNRVYLDGSMQLDRNNDEPQAYLTGWFFEEIEKFLKTI